MASTERFGYEWDNFQEIVPEYETQFLQWVAPLTKQDFSGKYVLDGGCGMGRNSYWPLTYGANKTYSLDFDERTVAAAKRTLSKFPNAEVVYQSIYEISKENEVDIAFSIGVIHHLERPHDAVAQLVKATKSGGKVLIWVYGREGNEWIVSIVNPLRKIFNKLPPFLSDLISYVFAIPLWIWIHVIPQRRPYFKQLATYKFWHMRSIVLDQLLPKVANYWTEAEARALFEGKGLTDIQTHHVNDYSWTVIGTKV